MTSMNQIANWLQPAIDSMKRSANTTKDNELKTVYERRLGEITQAQMQLKELGQTPIEEYIEAQKKKGAR